MKQFWYPCILIIVTIIQLSAGLRCYECISEKGLSLFGAYHKDCKEGDLPDFLGIECRPENNIRNKSLRLFPQELREVFKRRDVFKAKFTWFCTKLQLKKASQ
ncbi:uncharacterized protein LOC110843647 isoform X2 [Folsomia candida]|uniref:uncharacterized protein LOC110843647 isoform X2 n=1 Tax=Folsomia candida TaxID=158441 RepID=UPI000B9007C9|nr:uncharacterized protein LOC110843647 isoform X2 [Folsomia candida]